MGRELQKKKNRSGVKKLRMKPKSKKTQNLQHPLLAANWDKTATLSQNYKRLGLTSKLNKNTGGIERKAADLEAGTDERDDNLKILGKKKATMMEVGEAVIERDPVTGAILRVIEPENQRKNPLNDALNGLDSDEEEEGDDGEEFNGFNEHASNIEGKAPKGQAKTSVVAQLEAEAARVPNKFRPRQSEGERAFIEELVQKYGEDVSKMARDTKINYMQRSEGDLKRRLKKWKDAGGSV